MPLRIPEDREQLDAYLDEGRRLYKLVIVEFGTLQSKLYSQNRNVVEALAAREEKVLFIRVDVDDLLKSYAEDEDVKSFPTYKYYKYSGEGNEDVEKGTMVYQDHAEKDDDGDEKLDKNGNLIIPALGPLLEEIITNYGNYSPEENDSEDSDYED